MSNELTITGNPNYAAAVVAVPHVLEWDNCANVVGVPVLGYTAVVSKGVQVGDLVVVFPAESQLAPDTARALNLYRDSAQNKDPQKKGYLEENRRIRAQKFRGHPSNALVVPVPEFAEALGIPESALAEGVSFDTYGVKVLSSKYVVPTRSNPRPTVKLKRKRKRDVFLPEHIDTLMYHRFKGLFAPTDFVTVTQKIHGTSVRLGNTFVERPLTSWRDRLAKRFGVAVQDRQLELVAGSRKVVKTVENADQGYYGADGDVWNMALDTYRASLPEGVIVYGELIGWLPDGRPIQRGYTYDVPKGQMRLYVYRVAVATPDENLYDLSWEGVREFCQNHGFDPVVELWRGFARDFNPDEWVDRVFPPPAVPLSDPGSVDEGVVIRKDGITPVVLKVKSPKFYEYESVELDSDREVLD